jgi:transcriptional regulator with XRE-family HTH domain
MNGLFQRLKGDFQDKDYRHVYTNGFIDSKIATQIKVLREQRRWTQEVLAHETKMRQARISALEDVNYSSWSLSTLRRFARAFDLYIDVEFKEFGTLRRQFEELDRQHLSRRPFADDPIFTERAAAAEVMAGDIAGVLGQKILGSDSPQNKSRAPLGQPNGRDFVQALSGTTSESRNNVISWPARTERRPKEYAAISGSAS